jgi:hypothetical protein
MTRTKAIVVLIIMVIIVGRLKAQTPIPNTPIYYTKEGVAIGTNKLWAKLTIAGGSYPLQLVYDGPDAIANQSRYYIGMDNKGFSLSSQNDGNRWVRNIVHFQHDGKIGFGTTDPWAKLSIAGGSYPLQLVYDGPDAIANQSRYYIGMGNKGFSLSSQNDGNRWVRNIVHFQHDGKIGFGTTNPWAKLSIAGGSYPLQLVYDGPDAIANQSRYYIGMDNRGFSLSSQNDDNRWVRNIVHFQHDGKIGFGTTSPEKKLDVVGTIRAHEIVVSKAKTADFVFEEDYKLRPLEEVDAFVKEHKHLPEVASAREMERDGVKQSEMNQKLLQKIEELTLYIIEQEKRILQLERVQQENQALKKENQDLLQLKMEMSIIRELLQKHE